MRNGYTRIGNEGGHMVQFMLKRFIIGVTILILVAGLPVLSGGEANHTLSAREFKSMLDQRRSHPDLVILDIRTPGEFAAGHIAGAINVDYYGRDFVDRLKTLDRNKEYLIYCRSGNRTGKSLPIFADLGFDRIWHLDRGLIGWVKAQFPLVQPSG